MYGLDVIWVWTGWGAPIIKYQSYTVTVSQSISDQYQYQAEVTFIWLPATVECAETLYICMEPIWIWYEYEVDGFPQSQPNTHYKCRPHTHTPTTASTMTMTVSQSILYQAGDASIWLPAAVEGAETLYICMMKTCYEYEVGGVQQS
jgi:hypothetical protein